MSPIASQLPIRPSSSSTARHGLSAASLALSSLSSIAEPRSNSASSYFTHVPVAPGIATSRDHSTHGPRANASFRELPLFKARERHRHSPKAEEALELLKVLADQATTIVDGNAGTGIIANLEGQGWIYYGAQQGVRIFSKEEDEPSSPEREGSRGSGANRTRASSGVGSASDAKGKAKQGIRAHEVLFFRGETWIQGEWRVADVAAAFRSFGARAVWDPAFDAGKSALVEALSTTDSLSHLSIRGSFPVGDRDACIVSSFFNDADRNCGYFASRSVEDPLIPRVGPRTDIQLNGICIRALPRSPDFEPPPPKVSTPDDAAPPTNMRPSHRRTKSTVSLVGGPPGALAPHMSVPPPMPPMPPLPALIFPPSSSSTPATTPAPIPSFRRSASAASLRLARLSRASNYGFSSLTPEASRTPTDIELPDYTIYASDPSAPTAQGDSRYHSGLHVSFVVRASPGGDLPQSYVNQLSLNLPLSLAHLDRYLHSHGFPPYITRRERGGGLDILEERFDAVGAVYRVVYRAHEEIKDEDTRIRFWGSAFSRGRFNITVVGAQNDWTIEYDVEPDEPPHMAREEDDNDPSSPRVPRRTSLSFLASPTSSSTIPLPAFRPNSSTSSLSSPTRLINSLPIDPSRLPGPRGGCTLVIPNKDVAGRGPVAVTISKNPDRPRAAMRRMSSALGRASLISLQDTQSDSIEELLDCASGEGLAEQNLQGAREVLRLLHEAKLEEERDRGGLASLAASESVPIPVPGQLMGSSALGLRVQPSHAGSESVGAASGYRSTSVGRDAGLAGIPEAAVMR